MPFKFQTNSNTVNSACGNSLYTYGYLSKNFRDSFKYVSGLTLREFSSGKNIYLKSLQEHKETFGKY